MRRLVPVVVPLAAALPLLAACGGGTTAASPSPGGSTASASSTVSGTVTVLAAASLTGAFTTIAEQFEAANPGVKVVLSFAGSSALAQQIVDGAPADVFASASRTNMEDVAAKNLVGTPQVFATNVLEVAVPPNNPAGVTSVTDLAESSVTVAICQPQVPCGAAAQAMFKKNDLTVTPVTLEKDVKSVLGKVELGEVDAGVVYVTDVKAAGGKVASVPIPAEGNVSTSYPLAVVAASKNPSGAQAFVDYVRSGDGQQVLQAAGFGAP